MALGQGIGQGINVYKEKKKRRDHNASKALAIRGQFDEAAEAGTLSAADTKMYEQLKNLEDLGSKKIESLVAEYETGEEMKLNSMKSRLLEYQTEAAGAKVASMKGLGEFAQKGLPETEAGFEGTGGYGGPIPTWAQRERLDKGEAYPVFPGELNPVYEEREISGGYDTPAGPSQLAGQALTGASEAMGGLREERDAYIKSKTNATYGAGASAEEVERSQDYWGAKFDEENPQSAEPSGLSSPAPQATERGAELTKNAERGAALQDKISKYEAELGKLPELPPNYQAFTGGGENLEGDPGEISSFTPLKGLSNITVAAREKVLEDAAKRNGVDVNDYHKSVALQSAIERFKGQLGQVEWEGESMALEVDMERNPDRYGGNPDLANQMREERLLGKPLDPYEIPLGDVASVPPAVEQPEAGEPAAEAPRRTSRELVGYDVTGGRDTPTSGDFDRMLTGGRPDTPMDERRGQLIDSLAQYGLTPTDRKQAIEMISEKYPKLKEFATEVITADGEEIGYKVGDTFVKTPRGGAAKPQGWRLKSVTEDSGGKKSYVYENPKNLPTYVPTASSYAGDNSELTLKNENAPSEGQAKEFNTAIGNSKKIQEDARRLIEMTKDANWFSQRVTDRKFMAEVNTTIATMRGLLRPILIGPGAMSDLEQKMLSNALPDPSDFFRLDAATLQRFATLGDLVDKKMKYHGEAIGLWDYKKIGGGGQSGVGGTAGDPLGKFGK
jgi:hypothetical protein